MVPTKAIQVWNEHHTPFRGKSSSQESYIYVPQKVREILKTKDSLCLDHNETHDFQGETTARSDYLSYEFDSESKDSSEEEGTSGVYQALKKFTMKDSYFRRDNANNSTILLGNDDIFYGNTTNKEAYKPIENPLIMKYSPRRDTIQLGDESMRADNRSTSSIEYQGIQGEAARITKSPPSTAGLNMSDEFYSDTTNRVEYVDFHGVEPAKLIKPTTVSPVLNLGGEFSSKTTTGESYVPKNIDRPIPVLASERNRVSLGGILDLDEASYRKWDISTTNRDNYQGIQGEKARLVKSQQHPFLLKETNSEKEVYAIPKSTTTETYQSWEIPLLRKSLGVETVNNGFYVMIPKYKQLPTQSKQVFTTASDNQESMEIIVRQGDEKAAIENEAITIFEIVGVPPGPAGHAMIEVTFFVDADNRLHIEALDRITGKHQHIIVNAYGKNLSEQAQSSKD